MSDGHTPHEAAPPQQLEAAARAVAPKFLRFVEGLGEDEQRALALLFRGLATDAGAGDDDTAGHYVPYDLKNPTDEGLNPIQGQGWGQLYRIWIDPFLVGWWQRQTMNTLGGSNPPKRLRGSH